MQTFLIYPNPNFGLHQLDRRRLLKQRIEAVQILRTIAGLSEGWRYHPAVLMWRGRGDYLLHVYLGAVMMECTGRGYYSEWAQTAFANLCPLFSNYRPEPPPWLNREFCAAHRSNLLRKDPDHYGQFGWTETADMPYIWPV